MFGRIGPWEIGLVVLLILIIFGAGKLPNVMKQIGSAIKEFRKAQTDDAADKKV